MQSLLPQKKPKANQAKGASSSQQFATLSVLNPEDSLQEPTTFLPNPLQEANVVQVPNEQADLLTGPSGDSGHANESKLDNTTALFKPGSEYPKKVSIKLTEEPLGTNSSGSKERKINGKIGVARGGKNSNIAMRGRGSRLKALTNSRVSLVNTVEEMVNLISTELTNEKDIGLHDESDPSDTSEPQQ
ncbi:hypothetical protein GOBAR_AA33337 [Gossypium barbadense]|uniref:Uncharacterized protein n=1 Tax=Gossypium barbadense TaxID=3634 RepID=A0A2P5W8D4_GOSBA|nr:hypothetical protein GOBAR_AA33337 [Gossypium barbadense]